MPSLLARAILGTGRRLNSSHKSTFGAVVIGRNEGDRLKRCLGSLSSVTVVYVDSGSRDSSPRWAREHGNDVVDLDLSVPFTAARARNAGYRRLLSLVPEVRYVQFVDGDCELAQDWPQRALSFLDLNANVGAVFGRRRERYPDRSVYNWLCDLEWDGVLGETRACGGDVMFRIEAFQAVGGYRDDLIAGEEPELCVRLRAAGWKVWRLGVEMTLHDADMLRFSQWWRRTVRTGYAFAEGSHLHGAPPERHWLWESRRAWLWGLWLPLVCTAASWVLWPWGLAAWLIFPSQVFRQTVRGAGSIKDRATIALFQVLGRFPEALGQIKFLFGRRFGRHPRLIEYK